MEQEIKIDASGKTMSADEEFARVPDLTVENWVR